MRHSIWIALVLLGLLMALPGCPPRPPSTSGAIGAGGGQLRVGGATLTVPSGSFRNLLQVTFAQNAAGASVDTTPNETVVSDIYSLTQNGGLQQSKGGNRISLSLPYNSGAVTKANTNANVYAVVQTPDGPVRMFGELGDGTIELSLGGLLPSMDFQIVHNPNLIVSAAPGRRAGKLTQNAPWATQAWLISYDPADAIVRDVAAQLAGKPEPDVTLADINTHVRDKLMQEAQDASGYFEGAGFRQPNLEVRAVTGAGMGFVLHAVSLANSHFAPGILGSVGQLQIDVDRLTASGSGILGSITQTVTHEMFHAVVDGYELQGWPNGDSSSFRGHEEGLGQVFGHTRDSGAITVRSGETMFLDQRLGIDTDDDSYRSGDFYAYIAKRFGGGALNYVAGTAVIDGASAGLLEQVRLWVAERDPDTAAESYPAYLQGISNSFGGQFGFSLGETYWDFAKNRAFEHNDESRLRPADTEPRFSLTRTVFTSAGILSGTISDEEASEDVAFPSMPTMSTRVLEVIASGIDSDLTVTLHTDTLVPDSIGNSVRAKLYPAGADGIELSPEQPEAMLEGFGDGFDRAVLIISNVSDEKAFEPIVTLTTAPADDTETGNVAGRVTDAESGDPISGAAVDTATNDGRKASAVTDTNGQFFLANVPAGRTVLTVAADGYLATEQTVDVIANETVQVDVTLIVRDTGEALGAASGVIIDAVTGSPIAGVLVALRAGLVPGDDTSGPVAASATTDAAGMYAFTEIEAGVYTAFLSADGYEDGAMAVYVVGGEASPGQDGQLVPRLEEGEVRVVLTWGATPSDLDSHLTAPTRDEERFHLFYRNNGAHPYLDLYDLDLDDTSSFGPETTTIYELLPGTYRFSVHDYSNRSSTESAAMSNSGAQVQVFTATGVRTFNITPGTPATVWTVFEIDGTTGALTAANNYAFESDPGNAASFKLVGTEPANLFVVPEK